MKHAPSHTDVPINPRFLAIAKDPRIIHGVHHHCDEWCRCCVVTERCLAFRCTAEHQRQRGRNPNEASFESLDEAVAFTKALAALEGTPTDELDQLMTRGDDVKDLCSDDPLLGIALEYAIRAGLLLAAHRDRSAPTRSRRPTPLEVVEWHHVRIYIKLARALVGHALTNKGTLDRREDARGCAKLTRVSVARSREALQQLPIASSDDVKTMVTLLDALESGIDERFPDAHAYLRIGLDVPVA